MKSIPQLQTEIIQEFAALDGELERIMIHIIQLGRQLPPMEQADKNDTYLIKGCQSKVWLKARASDSKLYYLADSNTAITKGLASLLIRVFSDQPADAILQANLDFIENTGLARFIGTQRSNGLASIVGQIKLYAHEFSKSTSSLV